MATTMMNLRATIQGLTPGKKVHVPAVRAIDTVVSYQTYSVGGGEWSIEAKTSHDQSVWGPSIKEWVGSNGTQSPADDLWAEVEDWEKDPKGGLKVVRKGYTYRSYIAPDGTEGSYSFFRKEVMNGRLHGCLVVFK